MTHSSKPTAPCDDPQKPITRGDVVGVLLAGGQSRRMGGGDKGLLAFGDGTMLGHVIDRLAPQVQQLVLNANGDAIRFAQLGLPVVADPVDGNVGPLAGVLAGMEWVQRHRPATRYIATVSTDAPFIPLDLVERLAAKTVAQPGGIAIARSDGQLHPVIGLWPVAHAADLRTALTRDGVRKVLAWTDRHGTHPVDFDMIARDGQQIDPFFNANTPDELMAARRLLGD